MVTAAEACAFRSSVDMYELILYGGTVARLEVRCGIVDRARRQRGGAGGGAGNVLLGVWEACKMGFSEGLVVFPPPTCFFRMLRLSEGSRYMHGSSV